MHISGQLTDWALEQDAAYQELPPAQQTHVNNVKHDQIRNNAHTCVFAALSFCTCMLARTYNKRRWIRIAVPACMVFACIDEGVQHIFTTGRAFELSDILRDWLGTVFGTVAVAAVVGILALCSRKKREGLDDGVSGTGA